MRFSVSSGETLGQDSECFGKRVPDALTRAAQQLARAHEPKSSKTAKPGAGLLRQPTEYMSVASRLAILEKASPNDIVELARQVSDEALARCSSLRESLEALKARRSDHEQRRREFAEVAQGYDWTMVHRDRGDFIGPFSLDHSPEGSRLMLGRLRLRALEYPSGAELFEAIKAERRTTRGLGQSTLADHQGACSSASDG